MKTPARLSVGYEKREFDGQVDSVYDSVGNSKRELEVKLVDLENVLLGVEQQMFKRGQTHAINARYRCEASESGAVGYCESICTSLGGPERRSAAMTPFEVHKFETNRLPKWLESVSGLLVRD